MRKEAIIPPQRQARRIRSFLSSVSCARRSFSVIVGSPPHVWFWSHRQPAILRVQNSRFIPKMFSRVVRGHPSHVLARGLFVDVFYGHLARAMTLCQECAYDPYCAAAIDPSEPRPRLPHFGAPRPGLQVLRIRTYIPQNREGERSICTYASTRIVDITGGGIRCSNGQSGRWPAC